MNVVLLLWRTRLRSSWRSALILVVLIGLGGGVTLTVAAGARRTASANDAILELGGSSDISTTVDAGDPEKTLGELRAIPDVTAAELWVGFRALPLNVDPASILVTFGYWADRPTVDRPFITSGRLPTGPRDALLSTTAAARSGLKVGDQLRMAFANASFDDFKEVEVDIVGIGLSPDGVIDDELTPSSAAFLSRPLTEELLDRQHYGTAVLRLAKEDTAAVSAALAQGGGFIDEFRDQDRERVQEALQPLLWALAGLAGLAGGTTVAVAAQALGRVLRRRRVDDKSLATMGCTTRQLVGTDLAYSATVASIGVLLAAALAVAASPLFPVGPPRQIKAIGGVAVDLAALATGSLLLLALLFLLVGASSWRRRARPGVTSPGWAPGILGAHPASATGLRLLTGRRSAASTAVGVCAGLAALVAALTFTGSVDRLVGDPALVGMSWDVIAREGYTNIELPQVQAAVEGDPAVRRLSALGYLDGEVNGAKIPIGEVRSMLGDPWPPIVAGRAPSSPSEVLVGRGTLRSLRAGIGDEVEVVVSPSFGDIPDGPDPAPVARRLRVVGAAISPAIGLGGFDTPRLDVGVLLPQGTYEQMFGLPLGMDVVLFDLAPGTPASSVRDRFPEGLPDKVSAPTEWFTSSVPAEVSQAEEARGVIWLAVAALAIAVVGTIAHTILGFVRQRRRDYAVLKALGFTRRQIRATVLWQSGALVALALVGALPVGVAAGRWLWTGFAGRIGVVPHPVVPVLLLGAAALLSLLAVQGVALVPASIARRTPPGRTLYGE